MTKLNEVETTLLYFISENETKEAMDLVKKNHKEIDFSKKIDNSNYPSGDAANDTFLTWAIQMGMQKLSELILKHTSKSDIEHVNDDQQTALMIACSCPDMTNLVMKIIDTGHSNPSVITDKMYLGTALSLATVNKMNKVIIKLLNQHDMTPECVDFYGEPNKKLHNYGETGELKTAFDIATDIVGYSTINNAVIFEFIKYYYRHLPLSATFLRNVNKLCTKQNVKNDLRHFFMQDTLMKHLNIDLICIPPKPADALSEPIHKATSVVTLQPLHRTHRLDPRLIESKIYPILIGEITGNVHEQEYYIDDDGVRVNVPHMATEREERLGIRLLAPIFPENPRRIKDYGGKKTKNRRYKKQHKTIKNRRHNKKLTHH